MAESLERQMSQTGSHLMVNPFGPAVMWYNGKEIAQSDERTNYPIGTTDFKFLIRVNVNGTFDIQWKDGVNFNVTIETNTRICQLQVKGTTLIVPPWYKLIGDELTQQFSLRTAEFKDSHFRIMLLNSGLFRRVDFRCMRSSWATMILYENQIVNVCLQGENEMAILNAAYRGVRARALARPTNAAQNGTAQLELANESPHRSRANSVSTIASVDGNENDPGRADTPNPNEPSGVIAPSQSNVAATDGNGNDQGRADSPNPDDPSGAVAAGKSDDEETPPALVQISHAERIRQLEDALAALRAQEIADFHQSTEE